MSASALLASILDSSDRETLSFTARAANSGWGQFWVIFGAMFAVGALVFLFAFVFRKQLLRKRKHHHHRHDPVTDAITDAVTVTAKASNGGRKKRRRLRRHHRPLNPTLAQTHGLPPLRGSESTPPDV